MFGFTVSDFVLKFVNKNQTIISPYPTKYLLTINKLFSQYNATTIWRMNERYPEKVKKRNVEKNRDYVEKEMHKTMGNRCKNSKMSKIF